VIIEESDKVVKSVIPTEITIIIKAPPIPAFPTTQGNLRNRIIPRIVNKVGTKTP